MVHDLNNLSPVAIDCMKELGNIGSSSAANSLSAMLGKTVKMRVPDVRVLEYQQVIDELGGAEKLITGILVPLGGDIKGMMMFLLQESFAKVVINTFMQKDEITFHALDETERSTILEMGNIMAGSYLNALWANTCMKTVLKRNILGIEQKQHGTVIFQQNYITY